MKLMYLGPHDAVEVELPDGSYVPAVNGEPVEFPDGVAKSLLEQATWHEAAPAPEPTPKNKKAAKAEEE